jgi:hypothetical protein
VPLNPEHLRSSFASEASSRGNHVRAAIRRARTHEDMHRGRMLLLPLANQLAGLLAIPGEHAEIRRDRTALVHELIPQLLDEGGLRRFSLRLRVLFELQALLFEERRPDPLDFVETLRTFGRRPAKRPLPVLREVHRLRGLRRIARRLRRRVLLDAPACGELAELLEEWLEGAEARFAERHTARIADALEDAGVHGDRRSFEAAAQWILDRVLARGGADFLDLRDALAKGGATLTDLTWTELVVGDALLAADRRMAVVLDGVYLRSESYLQLFQRAQSMLFGTRAGRLLSSWALFPLLFAFTLLEFVQHVLAWFGLHRHLVGAASVGALAVLFSLLMNLPRLRRALGSTLGRPLGVFLERFHGGPPEWAERLGARIAEGWRRLFGSVTVLYYRTDEAIRYRGGHGRWTRHAEAWIALFAFLVGYVFRFLFRLSIEPTMNPLKHFPVVTVAGKLSMTGLFPLMVVGLRSVVPIGWAGTLALPICLFIVPGMAGFLAWEMRTNWSLYQRGLPPDGDHPSFAG